MDIAGRELRRGALGVPAQKAKQSAQCWRAKCQAQQKVQHREHPSQGRVPQRYPLVNEIGATILLVATGYAARLQLLHRQPADVCQFHRQPPATPPPPPIGQPVVGGAIMGTSSPHSREFLGVSSRHLTTANCDGIVPAAGMSALGWSGQQSCGLAMLAGREHDTAQVKWRWSTAASQPDARVGCRQIPAPNFCACQKQPGVALAKGPLPGGCSARAFLQ